MKDVSVIVAPLMSFRFENGQNVLMIEWPTVAGYAYTLESTLDLRGGWQAVAGATNRPGTGLLMSLVDTNPEPMKFYRVLVQRLP